MKRFVQIILLFVVSSEALADMDGLTITGVINNAETGEPLADAYVVVTWEGYFGIGHATRSCYKARYAETNSSGKYLFPAFTETPTSIGPYDSESEIIVYKPGYASPHYGGEYFDRENKDDLTLFTGNTEERLEYLDELSGNLYCGYEDKIILPVYKAIYQEMRALLSGSTNNKLANGVCYRIAEIETQDKNVKYDLSRIRHKNAEYINKYYPECLENEHFRTAIEQNSLEFGESLLINGLDPNSRYMEKSLYTDIIRAPSLTWDERTEFLVLLNRFGGNPYLTEIYGSPIKQLSRYVKVNLNNEGAQSLAALKALLSTSRQNVYFESLPLTLKYVALSGNLRVDIIEAYIEAGHDINEPIGSGHNLLTYSVLASNDSTEIIQYLLDSGADVNHMHPSIGQTSLQMAISHKYPTVASLLIDRGVAVGNIDKKGQTGLHLAAAYGQNDLAKRLIELDVDMDITDRRGQTALHYAAHYGHYEIARHLIEAGANTTIMDNEGRDALWLSNNSHIPDEATVKALNILIQGSP